MKKRTSEQIRALREFTDRIRKVYGGLSDDYPPKRLEFNHRIAEAEFMTNVSVGYLYIVPP